MVKNVDYESRRRAVLSAAINKHIHNAEPVASEDIAENFGMIVWLAILGEAVKFFLVWISIIYSAKFITKIFIIKDRINIARISTILLCFSIASFRILFFDSSSIMNYIFSSMHLISLFVIVPFFYFFSKNQIGNNEKAIRDED